MMCGMETKGSALAQDGHLPGRRKPPKFSSKVGSKYILNLFCPRASNQSLTYVLSSALFMTLRCNAMSGRVQMAANSPPFDCRKIALAFPLPSLGGRSIWLSSVWRHLSLWSVDYLGSRRGEGRRPPLVHSSSLSKPNTFPVNENGYRCIGLRLAASFEAVE